MSALRLYAAALIAVAVAQPAVAGTPEVCAEGAGAMTMDLYSVALERLDDCLALESLTVKQRVEALRQRGDAQFALEANEGAVAD